MPAQTNDNLTVALEALEAEAGVAVERDDLPGYLARIDAIMAACRAVKGEHQREVRNLASKASRARRQERITKALELLAEQEAAQKDADAE